VAAQNGHADVVRLLCKKGAVINKVSANGSTPLYVAAQNGHMNAVEALLEFTADMNLAYGAGTICSHNQTRVTWTNIILNVGYRPLYIAAQKGHFEIVKHLVEKNADVNAPTLKGATPLYVAAQKGHMKIVEYLLENNADINARFQNGYTPVRA
jgi:ankyrin repeat protein